MAVSPSFHFGCAGVTQPRGFGALVEVRVFQVRLPVCPRLRQITAEQAVDEAVMDVGHDPQVRVFPVSLAMIVTHPRIDALPNVNHVIESGHDQQLPVKGGVVIEHLLGVLVLAGTFHSAQDDLPLTTMGWGQLGKCQLQRVKLDLFPQGSQQTFNVLFLRRRYDGTAIRFGVEQAFQGEPLQGFANRVTTHAEVLGQTLFAQRLADGVVPASSSLRRRSLIWSATVRLDIPRIADIEGGPWGGGNGQILFCILDTIKPLPTPEPTW